MANGPNVWDVGDEIIIEVIVLDPTTGSGLIEQGDYITLTIQRNYDDKYWEGSSWTATRTELSVTENDSTNEPGRYYYSLNGSTGNIVETRYLVHANIDNSPTITADAYEVHVSRVTDVKVYESEPV